VMRLEREGATAWIRWSRPERLNAFDPESLQRLGDLLAEAALGDVRAIVCFGEGGAFSSGDDLRATAAMGAEEWRRTLEAFNRLTREVLAAPQPVIAAIDGVCVGGAFEFAYACDIRVATPRSRFGCPEVAIGLSISNGFSLLAPRAARRLVLTGELVEAEEALRLGLVDKVVDDAEGESRRLGERIASLAPLAVTGSKRLLDETARDLIERALERELDLCARLFETDDAREGLAAFLEKRSPAFGDR
jgi:enoyl-CoA hydratase